jgi:multiple sugar transport system permease protein
MFLVTAYPIALALWLSLQRYDLRFPDQRAFVGLGNYASVVSSAIWWQALFNTAMIAIVSVTVELVLGLGIAFVLQRAIFARGLVRASVLVPYGIITVVAALAWKFAFDPATGFVNPWLGLEQAWLAHRGSALVVILATEIWKTTPFMALLLLSGLVLIPDDLLRAARVDGASARQRLVHVILPLLRPTILVAVLFRALDAFRIFDAIYVQTRGAQATESVSIVGYETLIVRLNLGLGSAVSVLIFGCVVGIAAVFISGFGASLPRANEEQS